MCYEVGVGVGDGKKTRMLRSGRDLKCKRCHYHGQRQHHGDRYVHCECIASPEEDDEAGFAILNSGCVFHRRRPLSSASVKSKNQHSCLSKVFSSISSPNHFEIPHVGLHPILEGLSGLLKPPTRFMYCRYCVFFSFLTA